jgi:hypothetical protein
MLKDVKNLNTKKAHGLIGVKALDLNFEQIDAQKDADGNRFPPYTPRWQAQRERLGLYPVNRVDLTITHEMLDNFDVQQVTNQKIIVGFSSLAEKRKALGVLRNKKRPIQFVGLTRKSEKMLRRFIRQKWIIPNTTR